MLLWAVSFVLDVASLRFGNAYVRAAFYCVSGGVAAAIIFAAATMLDYNRVPTGSPARNLAVLHGFILTSCIALFALDAWVRALWIDAHRTPFPAVVLSALGLMLVGFNAFLSSQLIFDQRGTVARLVPPEDSAPPGTIPFRPRRR
jgi:uncharacterized membrane protein